MIEVPNIVAASLRGQIGYRESQLVTVLHDIRNNEIDDITVTQIQDVIDMLRLLGRVFDPSEYNNEGVNA